MITSAFKKSGLGLLLLIALSVTACAKKEGGATRVAGRGAQNGAAPIPQTPNTCGAQIQNPAGKIYGTSSQFEYDVKGFVSATLDPQLLGQIGHDINSPTGIDFYGSFQFDSNGNLVPQNSSVSILIFDSYSVSQNGQPSMVPPYEINFSQAFSGSRQGNNFMVTFKDEYGEFTFNGSVGQQGTAQGTVSYRNYTAVPGYTAASGTLGQFLAYECALIK